jgi:hypothetical protein
MKKYVPAALTTVEVEVGLVPAGFPLLSIQLKFTPALEELPVNVTLVAVQVMVGVALRLMSITSTSTVYELEVPAQPPKEGVTVYVTETGAPVVLVKVSLISPVPEVECPVIPVTDEEVHANVEPTPVLALSEVLNVFPEQMAAGGAALVMVATGFTVTE